MTEIRVLLAASYGTARAGLRALLADDAGLRVVAEAGGGLTDWPDVLAATRPDVVVADDGPALDSVGLLSALAGGTAGLVLLGDAPDGWEALMAADLPGWAFLLRDADGGELAAAARGAAAGLVVLDRSVVAGLPREAAQAVGRTSDDGSDALTARERDVLQLLAMGLPNKQIATRLGITAHTVKFHVASLLAKLGAASRTEAVTKGARRGDVLL